ncbi:MAG: hypothetical protein EAZ32_09450 [Cytophagia bacterium]|nr:MAG: hypothetical protein EAZ46_08005 [Runella sp.]TAG20428.1 MAG: hypothetical protein EAZ38_10350 [Cytophagales bacterium]TAG39625.1 MAG: hypothetical protein EAZ32_09450 [Cytophagia bacterium]TAG54541.1 MAG: hypothetical protein EAZ29_04470 [Runella slithyformis]TAG81203.1 MAG: hypothetical protein EAZ22_07775 [Cytophagales bacterium]
MSLFALLKEILDDSLVEQVAKMTNEKPEKIQKIISGLGAALIGGLIKRAANESGLNLVNNQVQKFNLDTTQLQTALQDPTDWSNFLANGDKMFHTLLPSIKSPVTAFVAKYAGTRNSLVSSLCGLVAPAMMAALKKQVANQKLDASGIANYLGDQRENLLQIAPELNPSLIEIIGLQSLMQNFSTPQIEESAAVKHNESKAAQPFLTDRAEDSEPIDFKPYLKWAGALLLVAGLIAGGMYVWNQRSTDTDTPVETENDTTDTNEARIITDPVSKDSTTEAAPAPQADSLNLMRIYLTDATTKPGKVFKFMNVDFEDNTLQLKPAAAQPVQELANLLKSRPTAEIKLIGYANDAQLPMTNKMLSVKRVYALKQQLIDAGVGFVRVDAEGLGNGVMEKDTARRANRVPMREILVKFIKK